MIRERDNVAHDQSSDCASATPPRRVARRIGSPCVPLAPFELAAVRAMIGQHGLQAVSRMLTIASAAAGAALRQGNHMLLSDRIRAAQKTDIAFPRGGAQ